MKCLNQIGQAGTFHHIIRRSVAMTDTLLFEQPDNIEFANLPPTSDGVFGEGLEALLKFQKEKKKQINNLVQDMKKNDLKRKFSSTQSESNKRPADFLSHSATVPGANDLVTIRHNNDSPHNDSPQIE